MAKLSLTPYCVVFNPSAPVTKEEFIKLPALSCMCKAKPLKLKWIIFFFLGWFINSYCLVPPFDPKLQTRIIKIIPYM